MITEIEVEGIGIMRPLNNWQMNRAKRITNKQNRAIAFVAFGLGMSVAQFKRLPVADQKRIREAELALTSPGNVDQNARRCARA